MRKEKENSLCSYAIVVGLFLITTIPVVWAEALVGTLHGAAADQNGSGRIAESNEFMHWRQSCACDTGFS